MYTTRIIEYVISVKNLVSSKLDKEKKVRSKCDPGAEDSNSSPAKTTSTEVWEGKRFYEN